MRTYLLALGIALSAGTLLYLDSLQAAPGDAIYAEQYRDPEVALTGPQKASLGPLVSAAWPDSTPADIDMIKCWQVRQGWACNGRESPTFTDAEYLDQRLAGKPKGTDRQLPSVKLGAGAQTQVDTWVQGVFGLQLAGIYIFRCDRQEDGTTVLCKDAQIKTVTPATFRTDEAAGTVLKLIGKVE